MASHVKPSLCLLVVMLGMGCETSVDVVHDKAQADQKVAHLRKNAVRAKLQVDAPSDQSNGDVPSYHIVVPHAQTAKALRDLRDWRDDADQAGDHRGRFGASGLFRTPLQERIAYEQTVARSLEQALGDLPGVLGVSVHVSLGDVHGLQLGVQEIKPSGSVLISHEQRPMALDERQVAQIVAGALSGLEPDRVAVVFTKKPAVKRHEERYVKIGPLNLAPTSAPLLKQILAAGLAMMLVMASVLIIVWRRMKTTST